jgi:hypothetical protein
VELTVGRHRARNGAGVRPLALAALTLDPATTGSGTPRRDPVSPRREPAGADGDGGGLGWPGDPVDGTGLGWPARDVAADEGSAAAAAPVGRPRTWRRFFFGDGKAA